MKNITSRSVFLWSLVILAFHGAVYFFMFGFSNPKEALVVFDDPVGFLELPFFYSKWIHVLVIPLCLNVLFYFIKKIERAEFRFLYFVIMLLGAISLANEPPGFFSLILLEFLILMFAFSFFMTTPFISLVGVLMVIAFMVFLKPQIAISILLLFGFNYGVRATIFSQKFWERLFKMCASVYR